MEKDLRIPSWIAHRFYQINMSIPKFGRHIPIDESQYLERKIVQDDPNRRYGSGDSQNLRSFPTQYRTTTTGQYTTKSPDGMGFFEKLQHKQSSFKSSPSFIEQIGVPLLRGAPFFESVGRREIPDDDSPTSILDQAKIRTSFEEGLKSN